MKQHLQFTSFSSSLWYYNPNFIPYLFKLFSTCVSSGSSLKHFRPYKTMNNFVALSSSTQFAFLKIRCLRWLSFQCIQFYLMDILHLSIQNFVYLFRIPNFQRARQYFSSIEHIEIVLMHSFCKMCSLSMLPFVITSKECV